MNLSTKQLKTIINEELQSVIKEQKQIKEMKEFFALSDKMLMLNEGKIGDFLKKAPSWFSSKWKFIKDLVAKTKVGVTKVYAALKARGGALYKILSEAGWSLPSWFGMLKKGAKVWAKLQTKLAEVLAELPALKQAFQAGEIAVEHIDKLLEKAPMIKKYLAGPAVGALLLLIWTQMAFTGDWKYDFDVTTMLRAMQGEFDLKELFLSPEGKRLLMLLAIGIGIGGFPWLSGASTAFRVAASLIYTLWEDHKGKTEITVSSGPAQPEQELATGEAV